MESYVSVVRKREHRRYLSADREYNCFFVGNRLKEGKREGTADDIYYIESVKEGDQDQEGNVLKLLKYREHDM